MFSFRWPSRKPKVRKLDRSQSALLNKMLDWMLERAINDIRREGISARPADMSEEARSAAIQYMLGAVSYLESDTDGELDTSEWVSAYRAQIFQLLLPFEDLDRVAKELYAGQDQIPNEYSIFHTLGGGTALNLLSSTKRGAEAISWSQAVDDSFPAALRLLVVM